MTDPALISQLEKIVGPSRVLHQAVDLACYAYDARVARAGPATVVYPTRAEQVHAIVELAGREGLPLTPRGAGTSITGGAVPEPGGIVVCTTQMNRIVGIDSENLTATVEPGVVLGALQDKVEQMGLFYPPDPDSLALCTIGGNVAQNAGGPRGVKYGSTKDYVLGLEVVLADGTQVHTGASTVKNASGYDLTHLFVGSEGTLGFVTQVSLRLLPLPERRQLMVVAFGEVAAATEAAVAVMSAGLTPGTLDLLDRFVVDRVRPRYPAAFPTDAGAILMIELDGSRQAVARLEELVGEAVKRHSPAEMRRLSEPSEIAGAWAARRTAFAAVARDRSGVIVEDVTVPRAELGQLLERMGSLADRYELEIGVVAHAGDGNLHPLILCDRDDDAQRRRVDEFTTDLFQSALALGGLLSGEHGIGLVKAPFMEWQHRPLGVEMMARLKDAFDPRHLLNPGKVIADPGLTTERAAGSTASR